MPGPQALRREHLVLQGGHGLEIALPGAEGRHVCDCDVPGRDRPRALRELPGQILAEVGIALQDLPDQGQARAAHQFHPLRFDEPDFHPGSPIG
jgi:hypothetical protein